MSFQIRFVSFQIRFVSFQIRIRFVSPLKKVRFYLVVHDSLKSAMRRTSKRKAPEVTIKSEIEENRPKRQRRVRLFDNEAEHDEDKATLCVDCGSFFGSVGGLERHRQRAKSCDEFFCRIHHEHVKLEKDFESAEDAREWIKDFHLDKVRTRRFLQGSS